jgi:septal ring factor EnvC (AmiA/AmiB activator)
MTPSDKGTVKTELQRQLEKLREELKGIMADRRRNESGIKEARKMEKQLLAESAKIATEEGNLRKQISELEKALQGLRE